MLWTGKSGQWLSDSYERIVSHCSAPSVKSSTVGATHTSDLSSAALSCETHKCSSLMQKQMARFWHFSHASKVLRKWVEISSQCSPFNLLDITILIFLWFSKSKWSDQTGLKQGSAWKTYPIFWYCPLTKDPFLESKPVCRDSTLWDTFCSFSKHSHCFDGGIMNPPSPGPSAHLELY